MAAQSVVQSLVRAGDSLFSKIVQTGSEDHPDSYLMGTGVLY